MTRAYLCGLAVLLALYAPWFASLIFRSLPDLSVVGIYGAPLVASFVTAYLAPRHRIFLGIMIALPAALLPVAWKAAYVAIGGAVDTVGPSGGIIIFFLLLSLNTATCAVGGVVGGLLARRRSRGTRTTWLGAG